MPFYDYKCLTCGFELKDVRKTITKDNSFHICPVCQSKMHQVFSSPPIFDLKGKGWYKTDYKSKK